MNIFKSLKQKILKGIKRILNAFRFSYDGFKATFKSEPAFREDLFVFAVFLPISLIVDVSSCERALMIFSLIFILFAECVNTAIEVVIDRISTEIHPLSKKAKDIGSFIVLLSFVNALIIWNTILF